MCRALLDGSPDTGTDVEAVCLSALEPCLVALDAEGHTPRPSILYGIDTRATAETAWLNDYFGQDVIYEVAGMTLTTQSVGAKILWLCRHELEFWSRVDLVTTASSYLTFKIMDEKVVDRRTSSHFASLNDIWALEWSPRLFG